MLIASFMFMNSIHWNQDKFPPYEIITNMSSPAELRWPSMQSLVDGISDIAPEGFYMTHGRFQGQN